MARAFLQADFLNHQSRQRRNQRSIRQRAREGIAHLMSLRDAPIELPTFSTASTHLGHRGVVRVFIADAERIRYLF